MTTMKTLIHSGAVAFAAAALAGTAVLVIPTAAPASTAPAGHVVAAAAAPADGSGPTAPPTDESSPDNEDWG
jgi:hypothetical protein